MPDIGRFLIMVAIVELTPGPNMAYLAALTLGEGRRAGLSAVAGVALGLALIGAAAALGLAAIIANSPVVWQVLRWSGIAFLLWLAWQGWSAAGEVSPSHTRPGPPLRNFEHGLITNLLNPKAALFYIAVLPEFVDRGSGALGQTLLLTAISVSVATIVHLMVVSFAAHAHPWLSDPARNRGVRRALALALAGVAIWFAMTTQPP